MQNKTYDEIDKIYSHYYYRCFVCGGLANQLAHIISNSKKNKRIYGSKIIDSSLNVLPACSLACNALIDAGGNLDLKEKISYIVNTTPPEDWHYSLIEREVRKNIKRKKNKTAC